MGVIVGALIGLGTAAVGYAQNRSANKANATARSESQADYQERLRLAAVGAKQLQAEYDELIKERPGLDWASFVKDKIAAIDDPALRQFYSEAKNKDFQEMRNFAEIASTDNMDNFLAAADRLSGGRWKEVSDERINLIMNTDAAERFRRTNELAAPLRTGASTTKYDDSGRLIEGQRSDKQVFSVANEVETAIQQEKKADIRAFQQDTISAAASQTEKAKSFMPFFDATGFASAIESDRFASQVGFQMADEQRAADIYKMFAGAAAGIAPVQPTYQDNTAGNELIASGIKSTGDSISAYRNRPKTTKTA